MKVNLSDKTSRFAKRTLADSSEKMIAMLADMPLEEISVQKICDVCNYPRSTFYNYFDDIYDLMDYCWIAIMNDMNIEEYLNVQGEQNTEQKIVDIHFSLPAMERQQVRQYGEGYYSLSWTEV